jgi:hypothetical protein
MNSIVSMIYCFYQCIYELSYLWIVVSMNCRIYELTYIWIDVSMNYRILKYKSIPSPFPFTPIPFLLKVFFVNELSCLWIVLNKNFFSMHDCIYKFMCLCIFFYL